MHEEEPRHSARRRAAVAVIAIIAALALIVMSIAPALADETDSFTHYWVDATANRDGTIDVEIDLEFDFGDIESHGVYLTYITRQRIENDPNHYRVLKFSGVTAHSETAPDLVRLDSSGDGIGIYVGDPDIEITGTHQYTISFTVDGVVNPGAGDSGEDEIYWNVIGTGFEQPINDVRVTLTAPNAPLQTACWYGEIGSRATCTEARDDGDTAHFSQTRLAAGEGMTIAAAYPQTFPFVEPILEKRTTFANTMGGPVLTSISGGAALLLAFLAPLGLAHLRRDERYEGITPGTFPRAGEPERIGRARRKPDAAVQFEPPAGLAPADVGLILRGGPSAKYLAATLIDLAVRGYLQVSAGGAEKDGWQLVRLREDTGDLSEPERDLLEIVFGEDTSVNLKKLPRKRRERVASLIQLDGARMKSEGWFTSTFNTAFGWSMLAGSLLLLAGILTVVFGSFRGVGMLGVPILVTAIVVMVSGRRVTKRTANGHAYYMQALGFKKYLETAEANQLRFEAEEDIFSAYLPYAMVFGVANRWVGLFETLAAQGQWHTTPAWYVGPMAGASLFSSSSGVAAFTSNLAGLEQAASLSAMTGSTSGSSGGSAFSGGGGFSGGGVGGGGGGRW